VLRRVCEIISAGFGPTGASTRTLMTCASRWRSCRPVAPLDDNVTAGSRFAHHCVLQPYLCKQGSARRYGKG
jgi:hypothetical protein